MKCPDELRLPVDVLRTATPRTRTVTAWRASSKRTIKALRRFSCMDPPTSLLSSTTWRGMSADTHRRGGTASSERKSICRRQMLRQRYWIRERGFLREPSRANEGRKPDGLLLPGERSGTCSTAYLMWWDWKQKIWATLAWMQQHMIYFLQMTLRIKNLLKLAFSGFKRHINLRV